MPLSILLPLVVTGIAGITLMLHLMGYSRRAEIADSATARVLWLRQFPDLPPRDLRVARDRHAALVRTDRGPGLVWSLGADSTARLLTGAEIHRRGGGLVLRLHDFTAPTVTLRLDADEARLWQDEITRSIAA